MPKAPRLPLVVLVLIAVPSLLLAKAKPKDEYLPGLHAAAKCDDAQSPWRPWCIAADGWAKGKAAALPKADVVLIGITVELEKGKSFEDALSASVYVSALALHHDGKKVFAKITTVKPENADEQRTLGEAVANISMVFKGKAETVQLDKGLYDYLATLPAAASYPVKKAGGSWTWTGASAAELRQAGPFWVTIETPSTGTEGRFVSVFTDKLAAQ